MTLQPEASTPAADTTQPGGPPQRNGIQKRSDVCGGDACVRNTRVTVWGLVAWRRLGLSDRELLDRVPVLTQSDLEAAWEYTTAHADEIELALRQNEEA